MIDFYPGFNFPFGFLFYVKLALYILPVNLVCLTLDCTLLIFRCNEYHPYGRKRQRQKLVVLKDPKLSISCKRLMEGGWGCGWMNLYICEIGGIVYFVGFFSSRPNWDSPTPSRAGECAPHFGSGGGSHSLEMGEGVGGVPIPTRDIHRCNPGIC